MIVCMFRMDVGAPFSSTWMAASPTELRPTSIPTWYLRREVWLFMKSWYYTPMTELDIKIEHLYDSGKNSSFSRGNIMKTLINAKGNTVIVLEVGLEI
jgi:hypothetical protein